MSPEEHFRRLKDDDVWGSRGHAPTQGTGPVGDTVRRHDRGPIWVTGIVAAALVVLTVGVLHAGPARHSGEVGRGALPASGSAGPTRTTSPAPSATPSDTQSADTSDPSMRQLLFYPNDPADTARAKTIIACFHQHGVRVVGLEPAEGEPGAKGIAFGGPKNDHESIVKGLQFAKECFKAGGPAE